MKIWVTKICYIYEFVAECNRYFYQIQLIQNDTVVNAKEIIQVLAHIDLQRPVIICIGTKDPAVLFKFSDMVKQLCII